MEKMIIVLTAIITMAVAVAIGLVFNVAPFYWNCVAAGAVSGLFTVSRILKSL